MSNEEHLGTLTRDLLANERTFLAWLRTAVSMMVVGFAVARLFDPGDLGALVAGVLLVVLGAVGVAYGTRRFRTAASLIERGDVAGRDSSKAMTAVSTVLVVSVTVALLLLIVL